MSLPEIVSRAEWVAARKALLVREKEATRAHDALNTARRELPMVEITTGYPLTGPAGPATLADLFEGRRQLIVQHFMFDPAWDAGCSSCTAGVDELSPGLLRHLAVRDTTFALVSRAPIDKLERYRRERGWDVPWYSSYGGDFNYDFHVTLDESVAPMEYNYRDAAESAAAGLPLLDEQPMERPGFSCFLRDGDRVFHTYSTFGRGTEIVGGSYGFLDMTALGRQEKWEKPEGRADLARDAIPDFAS